MSFHWTPLRTSMAGAVLLCLTALPANTQELALGHVVTGKTAGEQAATFTFNAESAGILTVIARAANGTDIVLVVTDTDGQPLPEGRSDQDVGGDTGAEQFAVTIPRAGAYRVRVEPLSATSATFRIGACWLAFPDVEVPADPDGSPSTAVVLTLEQQTVEDGIDGSSGDYWDWFVFTANQPGMLTVATRAEDGDLILEAYQDGEYGEALERSDQDLQGVSGNEALTLTVAAGQKLYFKVASFSGSATVSYRLLLGFIPE